MEALSYSLFMHRGGVVFLNMSDSFLKDMEELSDSSLADRGTLLLFIRKSRISLIHK